jgi:hypothetical protein
MGPIVKVWGPSQFLAPGMWASEQKPKAAAAQSRRLLMLKAQLSSKDVLIVSRYRAVATGRQLKITSSGVSLGAIGWRWSARSYQRMDSSMTTKQMTRSGQRWCRRISVNIPVQVAACALPAFNGNLKVLSLSGALMETDHELPLHAYIAISVKLPETGDVATRVMACVARQLKNAVALEWCEFAPRTVKDLLRSPSVSMLV